MGERYIRRLNGNGKNTRTKKKKINGTNGEGKASKQGLGRKGRHHLMGREGKWMDTSLAFS